MSSFTIKASLGASSALATLLLLQSGPAFAETPEAGAESPPSASLEQEEAGELKIETVVITARKQEENLQDVPITVSAISGATLAAERLDRVADYSAKFANFTAVQQNTRVSTLTVRGLGGNANSDGSEASVGLIVDNVFFTHPGFAWLDFLELEGVELAKGPQGTLLGKNTTLGALVVTTQKPSFDPSLTVTGTAASHDRYQFRANLTGPILGDKLAGRITAYRDTGGGYVTNLFNGDEFLDNDRWSVRGQLLYAGDGFTNRLIAEHYETEEFNNYYPAISDPQTFINGAPRDGWSNRLRTRFAYDPSFEGRDGANVDTQERIVSRTDGLSNQADWDIGDHTLTSVTAWRRLYFRPYNDSDGTPFAINRGGYDVDVDQYSQELRLASPQNGPLEYQAGIFLMRQDVRSDFRVLFYDDATRYFVSPALPSLVLNGVESRPDGRAETDTAAVFGQASYDFTDKLSLTGGLRYTYEKREASNEAYALGGAALTGPLAAFAPFRAAVTGPSFLVEGEESSDALSWLINPSYRFSDNILGYATISYGEKSGAANLGARPGDRIIIDPEKSTNYEAGLKTTLLNGRVVLNGNIYRTEIEDYQGTITTVTGSGTRSFLTNIGEVSLQGVEFEGSARASEALTLSFAAAFNDARYDSYTEAPLPIEHLFPGGPISADLSGTRVPSAPKFTGQISLNYAQPVTDQLTLFGYANQTWRSDTALYTLSEYARQEAYGLTNLGLGVRAIDDRWSLTLWARNLFDEEYATAFGAASATAPYIQILGEPRTVGITLTAKAF